jgi:hypothetical protein
MRTAQSHFVSSTVNPYAYRLPTGSRLVGSGVGEAGQLDLTSTGDV